MIAHLMLATAMVAGFLVIPIGYKFCWSWVQHRNLRISHASIMGFIAVETIVGLTCPLTILEYELRGDRSPQSFVGHWIQQILYWDLPHETFIALYFCCFVWVIFLWKRCPPRANSHISQGGAVEPFRRRIGAPKAGERSFKTEGE